MKKSLCLFIHSSIIIIPLYLMLFAYGCTNSGYLFIKTYEGPDLTESQVAKLFLDKSYMTRPDRDRPISFVVDGKFYEPYKLNEFTPCLFLLPGEHEVIIRPLPQMRTERVENTETTKLYKIFPIPEQYVFKFSTEKGGEYLVAQDYPNSRELDYMVFWIEDIMLKKRITEEIRFDWKKGGLPAENSVTTSRFQLGYPSEK